MGHSRSLDEPDDEDDDANDDGALGFGNDVVVVVVVVDEDDVEEDEDEDEDGGVELVRSVWTRCRRESRAVLALSTIKLIVLRR